jgi:hypothetical protein
VAQVAWPAARVEGVSPVYLWIWRLLPGGLPGKIAGSVLLIAIVVALLFFVVFPWVEPRLPFNDVTVNQ